jgi:hypothetical protein
MGTSSEKYVFVILEVDNTFFNDFINIVDIYDEEQKAIDRKLILEYKEKQKAIKTIDSDIESGLIPKLDNIEILLKDYITKTYNISKHILK